MSSCTAPIFCTPFRSEAQIFTNSFVADRVPFTDSELSGVCGSTKDIERNSTELSPVSYSIAPIAHVGAKRVAVFYFEMSISNARRGGQGIQHVLGSVEYTLLAFSRFLDNQRLPLPTVKGLAQISVIGDSAPRFKLTIDMTAIAMIYELGTINSDRFYLEFLTQDPRLCEFASRRQGYWDFCDVPLEIVESVSDSYANETGVVLPEREIFSFEKEVPFHEYRSTAKPVHIKLDTMDRPT